MLIPEIPSAPGVLETWPFKLSVHYKLYLFNSHVSPWRGAGVDTDFKMTASELWALKFEAALKSQVDLPLQQFVWLNHNALSWVFVWLVCFISEVTPPSPPPHLFPEDKHCVYVIKNQTNTNQPPWKLMNSLFDSDDFNTSGLGKPFGVCLRGHRMNFITATNQIFRSHLVTESRWKGNQLRSVHCKLFPHD